ncbi:hypothetical protein C8R42DRAFT_722923 [Lentinula raphanica]|nr:hypothetical protein C8R42DRAFT_722923 [Lentinula raphanica]
MILSSTVIISLATSLTPFPLSSLPQTMIEHETPGRRNNEATIHKLAASVGNNFLALFLTHTDRATFVDMMDFPLPFNFKYRLAHKVYQAKRPPRVLLLSIPYTPLPPSGFVSPKSHATPLSLKMSMIHCEDGRDREDNGTRQTMITETRTAYRNLRTPSPLIRQRSAGSAKLAAQRQPFSVEAAGLVCFLSETPYPSPFSWPSIFFIAALYLRLFNVSTSKVLRSWKDSPVAFVIDSIPSDVYWYVAYGL